MNHFAVIAPPFPSHFKALEAVAIELLDRGHRVTFFQQSDCRRWLVDPRIGFFAVGAQSHPPGSLAKVLRRAARSDNPLMLRGVIVDMARATDMLCRELPQALEQTGIDALLCDQMEAAGGLLGEAMALPWVSLACALPINREPGLPLPVMPFDLPQDARAEAVCYYSERVYDWMMQPSRRVVRRHAKRLRLTARDSLHECLSPYAQISQTLPSFDFPRRALPAEFHHTGPFRTQAPEPEDLPAFDATRPLIFASLGTLQGHRERLFTRIASACKRLDVQLAVAHCDGLDAQACERLQAAGTTLVDNFYPQLKMLARANVAVTHGGLNTVMDAISTGTPMLAVPIAFDQAGVAARIAAARLGLRMNRNTSVDNFEYALQQLLERPWPGLSVLERELSEAGGVRRAVDIIESVAQGQRALDREHVA